MHVANIPTMCPIEPDAISDRQVRETYDRIGTHFAKTRPEPWPAIERFLEARSGRIGLDVGVGNGRHAEILAERTDRVVGLDMSERVLATARTRAVERGFGLELCVGNAAALPIATGSIDIAVYIATIHHLSPRDRRVTSLDELARVLREEGVAIVSAWSVSHDRFDRRHGFDTVIDWTLPNGETVPRYYHIYDLEEFRTDLAESRARVVESFESTGNCFAVIEGT